MQQVHSSRIIIFSDINIFQSSVFLSSSSVTNLTSWLFDRLFTLVYFCSKNVRRCCELFFFSLMNLFPLWQLNTLHKSSETPTGLTGLMKHFKKESNLKTLASLALLQLQTSRHATLCKSPRYTGSRSTEKVIRFNERIII